MADTVSTVSTAVATVSIINHVRRRMVLVFINANLDG